MPETEPHEEVIEIVPADWLLGLKCETGETASRGLQQSASAHEANFVRRISDGQEYDLPMVRQGRRSRCPLLRRDVLGSAVGAVHRAPSDYPSGKEGDVMMVEFTVAGVPCIGLNGDPAFKHNEAFSFQIATDDQRETDRYWNAVVGNGGQESQCGWCKDKWGISWQITPRVLTEALAAGGDEAARVW